jgi:hypothetical protein
MIRYFASAFVLGLLLVSFSPAAAGDKPERAKPTNLDKLNTENDEDDPHLATNASALFYTSSVKGRSQVMVSGKRTAKAPWTAGRPAPDLTGKADFRSVFITPEGIYPQYLFYATNRDPLKKTKGDNYDIYFLMRQFAGADFTTDTALRVCTARDEMHPWLTSDGKSLYFSRKTKQGWCMFVTRRPAGGGQFGDAEGVGLPVGFHHATLMPNNKVMYMQGPLPKDRWGLFRSTLNGDTWSEPEPLSDLNDPEAPKGDLSPNLSRDGKTLFFVSDRAGGKGGLDIWMIPTAGLGVKKEPPKKEKE